MAAPEEYYKELHRKRKQEIQQEQCRVSINAFVDFTKKYYRDGKKAEDLEIVENTYQRMMDTCVKYDK
jgi:hypothetical protein